MTNDEKFLNYWSEKRKSKLNFIIVQGILYWAFPVLLAVILLGFLFGDLDIDTLLATLPIRITIWSAVGVLFGFVMWSLNERKYKQLTKKNEEIK